MDEVMSLRIRMYTEMSMEGKLDKYLKIAYTVFFFAKSCS